MSDVRQITPFCTPPRFVRPSSRPIVAPLFHSFLIGDLKYPILLVDRTTKMPGNRENQVESGDGGGSDGELQRLLDEGVPRCAAAGAGCGSKEGASKYPVVTLTIQKRRTQRVDLPRGPRRRKGAQGLGLERDAKI